MDGRRRLPPLVLTPVEGYSIAGVFGIHLNVSESARSDDGPELQTVGGTAYATW